MKSVEYRRILIVEDDKTLANALADYFGAKNDVTVSGDLRDANARLDAGEYDIVLLDVVLPDGSGLEILERVKGDVPVIILSDLGSEKSVLDGFDAGAADYIVKPCSPKLIEARMALRLLPDKSAALCARGLVLDRAKRTVSFRGAPLLLTSSEFNILMFLMQNPQRFFTANEIYEHVWKMPHLNTTTIKAHLHNLRKKMLLLSDECGTLILTEFGKGYAFVGDNQSC